MNFAPSERVLKFCREADAFVKDELSALEASVLIKGWEAVQSELQTVREKAKKTSLFTPHMSQKHGGAGLTLLEQAQVSEVLGRNLLGHYAFNFAAPDVGNMELLHAFGTEEQKERWLEPLARGEIRSTFLMTEPEHAGSNPVWMSTTAKLEGQEWVISGHKWFATAADGATFAVVMAVTDPEEENRYGRASMFIVPTESEGFELVRNISVMGHVGSGWLSHAEIRLHQVKVPKEALLGPRMGGFKLAQTRLGPGRIHHATRWVGVCHRALEMMCRHSAARELAPDRPLAQQQTVQEWIAESKAEIEAARLMVLQAAWKIEQHGEFREDVSLIKFFVAGVLQRVLDRAIQVHGALGMTDDTPLAFWYSHERAARIYDGPDEVHKRVVARGLLAPFGVELKRSGNR
jgi:acyl-CoA dehydrogenase